MMDSSSLYKTLFTWSWGVEIISKFIIYCVADTIETMNTLHFLRN